MGAVEHAEVAEPRHGAVDPPEEIVRALLVGGHLEVRHLYPGGIDVLEHAANGAVLTAGVHALRNNSRIAWVELA